MKTNKPRYLGRFFLISFLFLSTLLRAQTQTLSFSFEKAQLKIEKWNNFDLITYADFEVTQIPGAPQLPMKIVKAALPENKKIIGISVKEITTEFLPGEFHPFPAQPPQILSIKTNEFVEPNPLSYSSPELYPKEIIRIAHNGRFAGKNIGGLVISPVQYLASEKKLKFVTKLEVELVLDNFTENPEAAKSTEYSEFIHNRILKTQVKNPAQIATSLSKVGNQLLQEEHRYVIITLGRLMRHFQPLADWKLKKGLSAKIVILEDIEDEYPGVDLQEKIRNFIRFAWKNWGTVWVLLGGDTNIIPCRHAFAFNCESGISYYAEIENKIPCDLYYSDLDGDWNANGNDVYGEVDDNIDMYPDVFVGRAPVENLTEARTFVSKVVSYEENGINGHELNMMFMSEILWTDPYTNSGESKDLIDREFVPARFDPITKFYQHNGNENSESIINAMNQGVHIINHSGHAFITLLSTGDGDLGSVDMDNLQNGPNYSILFSIGCWPAAFDDDCVAEHFVTNPEGGGVAFIGNSRYGWGSPGNPVYGYSDQLDQQFFKSLFTDNLYHIGNALHAAKMEYIPYATQENVYRWCVYNVNLLGDPEMPVWTDVAYEITVQHPDTLPSGEAQCVVAVAKGGQPVANALVCLMQEDGVYETAITGLDGIVRLNIETENVAEEIEITVTAQNALPYESTISLFTDQAYVSIASCFSNGPEKGFISPNSLISLDCWFKNYGSQPAENLTATLSGKNSNITFEDDTESLGKLEAGDSLYVENAFSFNTSGELANGDAIQLNTKITDGAGNAWMGQIGFVTATPVLSYSKHSLSDSIAGDSDNFAEPGESVNVTLILKNTGLAPATGVKAEFNSNSAYLSLLDTSLDLGEVTPDSTTQTSFELNIAADCPQPHFAPISMILTADGGFQITDSLLLSIGEFGFSDNMEKDTLQWTHTGAPDLWHISSARKHSGYFSWNCGYEDTHTYANDMENSIVSQEFVIDANSELSFWYWYELPNYGSNGVYPEVSDGSEWKILDFIGSGGALGALTTGNDWMEYTYDLSDYPAGTTLQLRFRFISDEETPSEGSYIDDVIVRSRVRYGQLNAPPVISAPEMVLNENDKSIELSWANNTAEIEAFEEDGYIFQGYNVYQLQSDLSVKANGVRIATFDVIDGVTEITKEITHPETGELTNIELWHGSDSGIKSSFTIDKDYLNDYSLVKGKTYYFAVTAYAFNAAAEACPRCVESNLGVSEIIFQENEPGYAYGDTLTVEHTAGIGDGIVLPITVDPANFTGHTYQIDIDVTPDTSYTWSLTDIELNKVLLGAQPLFSEITDCPVVDGLKLIVKNPMQFIFKKYTVIGNGEYELIDMDFWDSSRAINIWGKGTNNLVELSKDYEFRVTGALSLPDENNIIHVKEGTGAMATIFKASRYELKDHPMNPNPDSNEPFAVRIPFEVWNIDDNRQVNLLFSDRWQDIDDSPFYASPKAYFFVYILNTPYSEAAIDTNSSDMEQLSWCLYFWDNGYCEGDVIRFEYENLLTDEDVFQFNTASITNVKKIDSKNPNDFHLFQNYPNPFNASTLITFNLPKNEFVKLRIYDILGREVRTLVNGNSPTGTHKINWDGKDNFGNSVASGIYFYELELSDFQSIHKMLLIK